MSEAMEVPFVEQLRGVDKNFRASYAFQWSEDGTETGHHCVPVGYMMHKAADRIVELEAAITKTLNENGHLADGDNCTLADLKRVMGVLYE